jgi:hypothetical protein
LQSKSIGRSALGHLRERLIGFDRSRRRAIELQYDGAFATADLGLPA